METVNINAKTEQQAIDQALDNNNYGECHILGETPASGDNPGFYKVALFDDRDEYREWAADKDWVAVA
jgi:hypothetical protein